MPRSPKVGSVVIGDAVSIVADTLRKHAPLGFLGKVIECQCPDRVILENFDAWLLLWLTP